MKIEELSIGDWVIAGGAPHRVFSVNHYGVLVDTSQGLHPYNFEFLSPIPITPEILKKNGFVKESEVGYERFEWRENGSVAITLNRDSFSKSETFVLTTFKIGINGWLLKIEHVHQLQHAIRLAGIEKEIEV